MFCAHFTHKSKWRKNKKRKKKLSFQRVWWLFPLFALHWYCFIYRIVFCCCCFFTRARRLNTLFHSFLNDKKVMCLVDWIGTCGMWKQSQPLFFFSFHFPEVVEGEDVRYEIFQCNSGKKGSLTPRWRWCVQENVIALIFPGLKLCTRTITTHLFNSFPLSFRSF